MKENSLWCCLWLLSPWKVECRALQVGEYIKTSCLNTHMYSFHTKMLIIAMFFGSLNHRVKENINVFPYKISRERFKSACPKLQAYVNKAKANGINGRSWRCCKEEQSGEELHSFYGVVWEPFMWCFCLVLWILGRLAVEDELTSSWILPSLLQEFEMRKTAALILGVLVVANNIILIIMLVWEFLGYSQS